MPQRKVHREVDVRLLKGNTALTADHAKELLGWTEVDNEDFLIRDRSGTPVKCQHNTKNRPFRKSTQIVTGKQYFL